MFILAGRCTVSPGFPDRRSRRCSGRARPRAVPCCSPGSRVWARACCWVRSPGSCPGRAPGFCRPSASGSRPNSPTPVVHQLLLPLDDRFERMGDPRRKALRGALGFGGDPVPDRLHVCDAVLFLLRQAATEHPVFIVVDDLAWLDGASSEVLGFVARRPAGSRIGARFPGLAAPVRHRVLTQAQEVRPSTGARTVNQQLSACGPGASGALGARRGPGSAPRHSLVRCRNDHWSSSRHGPARYRPGFCPRSSTT